MNAFLTFPTIISVMLCQIHAGCLLVLCLGRKVGTKVHIQSFPWVLEISSFPRALTFPPKKFCLQAELFWVQFPEG